MSRVALQAATTSLLCALFHHSCANDLDLVHRSVLAASLDQTHALDDPHPTLHPAEDCVLAIQPGRRRKSDEELTAICIGAAVRHAQNSGTGVLEVITDLILEFLAVDGAAAAASASRITGLDHEVGDDSVENDIVVVSSLRESRKVLAGLEELALATGVTSKKIWSMLTLGAWVSYSSTVNEPWKKVSKSWMQGYSR